MHFIKKQATPTALSAWKTVHKTELEAKYKDDNYSGNLLWKYLDNQRDLYNKSQLKQALLEDQVFICCYCGMRLKNDLNTRIEHLLPKNDNKYLTYDYANLLASCQGGTKPVIHVLQAGETLDEIAVKYGISVDLLEEINVTEAQVKAFRTSYNLHDLKAGNRLIIIPQIKGKEQHCDNKKGNIPITIHPLQDDCATHFEYNQQNGKIVDNGTNIPLHNTLKTLGLNNNTLLNRLRLKTLEQADTYKALLLKDFGHDKALFQSKRQEFIAKLQQQNTPPNELIPFIFVLMWSLNK